MQSATSFTRFLTTFGGLQGNLLMQSGGNNGGGGCRGSTIYSFNCRCIVDGRKSISWCYNCCSIISNNISNNSSDYCSVGGSCVTSKSSSFCCCCCYCSKLIVIAHQWGRCKQQQKQQQQYGVLLKMTLSEQMECIILYVKDLHHQAVSYPYNNIVTN